MGKKLGAVFIVYGILNIVGSIIFLFVIPIVGLAGIVWSIVFIGIGSWMRSSAQRNELLERMAKTLEEKR